MPGFCTVDDVRRVMQESEQNFGNDVVGEDNYATVVNAIEATSETIEKATKRYWYAPDPIAEDEQGAVATEPSTRDDEHDIQSHGGFVHGASEHDRHPYRKNSDALLESSPHNDHRRRELQREPKREIRIATGEYHDDYDDGSPAYTRIQFDRKDVSSVNGLHVIGADGSYDDWTEDKTGGVGTLNRGSDYWARTNNGGVSELYLDVYAMDDDIDSLSNAVYVDIDYGHEGLPQRIRRGTAYLVAYALVDDELVAQVPDNARYMDMDTKAERWGRLGIGKLEDDIEDRDPLEAYT